MIDSTLYPQGKPPPEEQDAGPPTLFATPELVDQLQA